MRVTVAPVPGPVGEIRLTLPARAARALGHDVEVVSGAPFFRRGPATRWGTPGAIDNVQPVGADVLVVQRPTHRDAPALCAEVQRQGTRLVVEVDDDYATIPAENTAHAQFATGTHHPDVLAACAEQADHVVVSTPALVDRYGAQGRVSVVPNAVPAWYLTVPHEDRPLIGYAGSPGERAYDMAPLRPVLQDALDSHGGWSFGLIGPSEGARHALGLRVEPESTGLLDLDMYARVFAQLGVAVVPLADNDFNRSKTALKMLQAAALGVPVIASPSPDNLRLHVLGVGLIAHDEDEWAQHLDALMASADLRAELAARGRDAVREMTYEATAEHWWNAWTAPLRSGVRA